MTDSYFGQLPDRGYSKNQALKFSYSEGSLSKDDIDFDRIEARFGNEIRNRLRKTCVHNGCDDQGGSWSNVPFFVALRSQDGVSIMRLSKDSRPREIHCDSYNSLEWENSSHKSKAAPLSDVDDLRRKLCSLCSPKQTTQVEQVEGNVCLSPAELKCVNRYNGIIQPASFPFQSMVKRSSRFSISPNNDVSMDVNSNTASKSSMQRHGSRKSHEDQYLYSQTMAKRSFNSQLQKEPSRVPEKSISVHIEEPGLCRQMWKTETEKKVYETVQAVRTGRPSYMNGDHDSCACTSSSAVLGKQQRRSGNESTKSPSAFHIPTKYNDGALCLRSPKEALLESFLGEVSRKQYPNSAHLPNSSVHSQKIEEPLKESDIPDSPRHVHQACSTTSTALPKSISIRLKRSPDAKFTVSPYTRTFQEKNIEGVGGLYAQGTYKTELCNKWESMNKMCPYGERCQFAHGLEELRVVARDITYKTQACRMVSAGELCSYGHRCHFRHALKEEERMSLSELPCCNSSSVHFI